MAENPPKDRCFGLMSTLSEQNLKSRSKNHPGIVLTEALFAGVVLEVVLNKHNRCAAISAA